MKNFWKILLGKSIDAVPDEFRKEFWQEVIYTNMRRLRLLLLISTLGYVFLIYFVNVRNIFQMTVENNQSVLILHLTIMLVNACFFLLTQVAMPANHHGVHRLQYRVLFATFCAVIFFFHFFIITVLKTGGYPVFAFLAFLMWVSSLLIPTRVFATFVIMMVASLVILMEIYPLELQAARITEEGKAAAILLSFVLIASSALFFKTFVEAFRQRKYVELERNVIAELHNETSNLNEELQRRQNILEQQASEIEIINTQLQEQNQELQILNAEKNELMGIVAHDLKNPIGAVRNFAELMHDGYVPLEEVPAISGKIMATSDRMLGLVTNLLDVNRLESGAAQFSIVTVNIAPILQSVVWSYRGQAEEKNITLHYTSESAETLALVDEQAIVQVLDNLVSNAVKYSPHGKNVFVRLKNHSSLAIGREVSHSSLGISHWSNDNNARPMTNDQVTNDFLRIEIADEGQGISPEDMKKLFGKFARLSARPTGGEHSTGLGLSIVKKMVEAMNGRVWCESEFGKGATFIVELPSAK